MSGETRDQRELWERRGAPAWVCVLLGWTLVTAWLERAAAAEVAALAGTQSAEQWQARGHDLGPETRDTRGQRTHSVTDLDTLVTPRSLRALDGVGELRALDVARFLWSARGHPGAGWTQLESIPGVGPELATKLRRAHGRGP